MQFTIIDKSTMKIEHPGRNAIIVNIKEFAKTKFIVVSADGNIIDPFKEINLFIEDCVKRQQKEEIFNAYASIFEEFALRQLDVDILTDNIRANLKIIYDIINVQDIHDYMERNDLFNIPPDIKEEFTGEYTEARTYNRAKYKGLIALSIAARIAIPIWGEFAPIRKNIVGSNRLPIPLMKMLVGTSILESQQFKEFELYSNSTVEAGTHAPELVAGGLGTEFNTTINLAANFVKKVATGLNLASNALAHNIYNFTANRGAYNDATSGDLIWAKTDMGQGEEEKSKMEKYALREPMSQGDVAMIEYYLVNLERSMRGVVNDIPDEYIQRAEKLFQHLEEEQYMPNDINIRMAQWVMMYILPPKVIKYVGFTYQRKALAAVAYILAYLGFPKLSALTVSTESISSDGFTISAQIVRRQISDDTIAKLNEFYPLEPKSKESSNMAIIAINRFYALVNNTVFKVKADTLYMDYLNEHRILNRHFCHGVKGDTPNELANMIIKINEIEEAQVEDTL